MLLQVALVCQGLKFRHASALAVFNRQVLCFNERLSFFVSRRPTMTKALSRCNECRHHAGTGSVADCQTPPGSGIHSPRIPTSVGVKDFLNFHFAEFK